MNDCEPLLERVRTVAADSENLQDPITLQSLDAAEQHLGFRLHPLLAALYTTVGNGGFGPKNALLELCDALPSDGTDTALGNYLTLASPGGSDPWWSWPAGVVPNLDWGCGMTACDSDDDTAGHAPIRYSISASDVSTAVIIARFR
ncbi:SMI1/KNR4 family protein [Streptomyces sp. NPDC007896]|uniref:SMI1/KNR4 family protein n=1 Tax=Streptomyces sp. NPDC007896 TaxID=3364784 RepID=UPI0036EC7017